MKITLSILLICITTLTIAQQYVSVRRHIHDDDKRLSIRVVGTIDGRSVDYDRSFDVVSLTKADRDALRNRVLDSLGISTPSPVVALQPRPQFGSTRVLSDTSVTKENRLEVSVLNQNEQVSAVGGKQPYTKEVTYDTETGRLFMRYRYTKNGDEMEYERTVNARDKSERERQRIIDDVEKELGLPINK